MWAKSAQPATTTHVESTPTGDGVLQSQPDLNNDPKNCGTCGNDCNAGGGNGNWGCSNGGCVFNGCKPGFIECGGTANDCETACTPGGSEQCNGVDDDCDCQVDEGITAIPTPPQVCNVLPAASEPGCLAYNAVTNPQGVRVTCSNGGWTCNFSSNYLR